MESDYGYDAIGQLTSERGNEREKGSLLTKSRTRLLSRASPFNDQFDISIPDVAGDPQKVVFDNLKHTRTSNMRFYVASVSLLVFLTAPELHVSGQIHHVRDSFDLGGQESLSVFLEQAERQRSIFKDARPPLLPLSESPLRCKYRLEWYLTIDHPK